MNKDFDRSSVLNSDRGSVQNVGRKANYQVTADALAEWRGDLLNGTPPTLFPIGEGDLSRIEIGPGMVTLIGGAPGAGKTAFTMQAVVDALRLTPDLRACVCNVEMSIGVLLDRQLARISGIDLTTIRHRRLTEEHADRIDAALSVLEPLAERLCFVRRPYDLANVAAAADDFGANLILLDYIQRIPPPGRHADNRGRVDATMSFLRQFADAGVAVIVVSAVGRTKDVRGRSSYDAAGLNLASFKESSELEFGADDAFILTNGKDDAVILRHLKSRHGECRDVELAFHRRLQRFTPIEAFKTADVSQDAIRALWNRAPADDDGEDSRAEDE
jgi:replicative DNA helicase